MTRYARAITSLQHAAGADEAIRSGPLEDPRPVHVTLQGYVCGESHHTVKHSDATVAALRADVAAGMSIQHAALKHQVLFYTARQWVRGKTRPGHARVVVRRRKVHVEPGKGTGR